MLQSSGPHRTGKWRRPLRLMLFGAAVLAVATVAGTSALLHAVSKADLSDEIGAVTLSKIVLDRNGTLLRAFQTSDDRWRMPLSLQETDPQFLKMLTAYEDRRFASHPGVNVGALLRAAVQAIVNGRIVSGGSTLTMQVARLYAERPTHSLADKLDQIVDALALERRYSKQEILGLYLLRAPYGGNIEGLRAATLAWFGKEPGRLTPAEAALLVALPQAPEARRPDRHPEAARQARDRVLDRMVMAGVRSADEAEAAKRDPVPSRRRDVPMLAAHAARQAIAAAPAAQTVQLTIDARLQRALETLVRIRTAALGTKISAAIIVADHKNGAVLARVASAGLLDDRRLGHVDMTRAVRSPGSTLKPLIYGLAFEAGIAHPESLIEDRPATVAGYSPTNFDLSFQGTVTVREALQLSLNVPAVKLLSAVGPARLAGRLRAAGLDFRLGGGEAPGLAIGLGGLGVTLWDLTELYAGLAHGGTAVQLRERRVEVSDAAPVEAVSRRFLDETAAWHVGDVLAGTPPPLHAAGNGIAYKTGTSYGYRDAWAVGYDGRHVMGVWVGRADGTPVPGISGYESAAPLLFEAFQRLGAERVPLPRRPAGVLAARTEALPPPLRRARVAGEEAAKEGSGPEIAYPPDGALVDLGLSDSGPGNDSTAMPLVVKLRRGRPPYVWFANGRPVASGPFLTSFTYMPDGPGSSTIAVLDGEGRSARVTVELR